MKKWETMGDIPMDEEDQCMCARRVVHGVVLTAFNSPS